MNGRKIIHVDMDAFYASVEQRDDAGLRGRPVVVAWKGARSVVCAASYEARRFGVHSAMPALRAERLCPEAVFIPPDFARYQAASRQMREILRRHTDLVEPLSLDEAYLDVTENKCGLPTATRVAKLIREQIREELALTASAGVAPNKFLAKIASDWRKPDGLFVVQPSEVDDFLAPLPIGRLPGVGEVTEARLGELGITRVGHVRRWTAENLEARLGRYGARLWQLSHGVDYSAVVANRPTKSISAETTFEEDVLLAATGEHIAELAERVWNAARRDGRAARTVVLKLKTREFANLTRSQTLSAPLASSTELAATALALRDRVLLGSEQRFRLVGVGISSMLDKCEKSPSSAPA